MTEFTRPWPSLAELGEQLLRRELRAVDLVERCLQRITAVDPLVNAVFAVDPAARAQARISDRRLADGRARPLEGIPVLVKDNVDTRGLATAAGSPLLTEHPPVTDADVVGLLRAAGAVVVGKTNLSEWGNFRSVNGIEGWSGAGGQTWNPHALDHSPAGSSSGSAAAVAAGLAPLAIGTETDGSVVCPASVTGVVGVKPEHGLLPVGGIVPISPALDTPGVLSGSCADAAACLAALTGEALPGPVPVAGLRLGVWPGRRMAPAARDVLDRTVTALTAAGATVVPVELVLDSGVLEEALEALVAEFRPSAEHYLAGRRGAPPTLAALIEATRPLEAPFGQDLFERALAVTDEQSAQASVQRVRARQWARTLLHDALTGADVSAVVAPTSDPAWPVDHTGGDRRARNTSTVPALAGYPHITVPAGLHDALPVGVSVFGPPRIRDALAIATAVETVCGPRPVPRLGAGLAAGPAELPDGKTVPVPHEPSRTTGRFPSDDARTEPEGALR
ncbi:amidase family protein [Streptomyces sp. NPDC085927]|uniref:amidase family protein n=1 Tax=Streptomyces sp. NPDC085927 TaxID=3365738 RepID=UPI0037D13D70